MEEPPTDRWLSSPLLSWEVVRGARRITQFLTRLMLPVILLVVLVLHFWGEEITQKRAAYFGEFAFNWYIVVQYLAVLTLTPIYVAGSFLEERRRGTLMLLLTTHLTPRDIVKGKMFGSLMPIVATMLAGLPVLAILQVFGGISFAVLMWHTTLAFLLMLTLAIYAMHNSIEHNKVQDAIFNCLFQLLLGYVVAAIVVLGVLPLSRDLWGSRIAMTLLVLINLLIACLVVYPRCLRALQIDKRMTLLFEPSGKTGERKPRPFDVKHADAAAKDSTSSRPIRKVHRLLQVPAVYESSPVLWKQTFFPDVSSLITLSWLLGAAIYLITIMGIAFNLGPDRYQPRDISYYLLRGTLLFVLGNVLIHVCMVLTTERSQSTLVSLLTLPMTNERLILQLAIGTLWRHLGLFLVCLLPWLESIFFGSKEYLLIGGTVLSQLAFLIMGTFALSLLLKTTLQTIMAVTVILGTFTVYGQLGQSALFDCLIFVPFQTFPHPFVDLKNSCGDVVALVGYWLCLWLGAWLLLKVCARRLSSFASENQ